MFKRIDHVEIVTDQLDRTVQFYTEVLGFTVKARDRIERSGLGVPIDLVYLDLGGTVVELISYESAAIDPAPQNEHLGYRMIALEVDDMQQAADYLRTKGVDIVWGPRVRETYSRAEICDPNGYHIELRQWVHLNRSRRDHKLFRGVPADPCCTMGLTSASRHQAIQAADHPGSSIEIHPHLRHYRGWHCGYVQAL